MTDKGFRVTVEDLESGEVGVMLVSPGDYMVIPFGPCRLEGIQTWDNGTVQLTLKDHRPERAREAADPASVPHVARRGTDVEAWLKRWRDAYRSQPIELVGEAASALDDMLNDYRDHADTGTPLGAEVAGPHGEDE